MTSTLSQATRIPEPVAATATRTAPHAVAAADSGNSGTSSGLLRFLTAGSVDDGKSTLIGRLLYDSKSIFADQLDAIGRSRHKRTNGDAPDLALLTDGLEAEREQGITIDVAYRYFATPQRKFIIADTPGHEQYTRNMVTGASTADAMIILIDASKIQIAADGSASLLTQTRRHSALAHLLGIRHLIVAVNKMDLVGYRQHDYQRIVTAYRLFAAQLGVTASVQALPLSALQGDNVVTRSCQMAWYQGPTLLELLEAIPDETGAQQAPFRLPVQLVIRHNGQAANSFRGYAGRIESGSIRVGDPIISQPGAHRAHVRVIHTWDGNLQQASAGQAVTLLLAEDLDISRGAMLADADSPPQPQTQLQADLCWLADEDLDLRHAYWLKHTTRRVIARIGSIESVLDVNTQQQHAAATLRLNDIARVTLSLQQPIAADAYADNRRCGAFILIDQLTHQTVAAGMIRLDPATPSAAAAHDATTA